MADFTIKEGDTSPTIEFALQDAQGDAVDVTGSEVRFLMRRLGSDTLIIDDDTTGAVKIADPTGGIVQYDWQAGDTDRADIYQAEWEVTFASGQKETFPNTDFISIEIQRDLD